MSGNGAVMVLVPDAPINLTKDTVYSSKDVISFSWEEAVFNGGKPVLEFSIWFDQANGNFIELASTSDTDYTTGVTLTSGLTYTFYLLSKN